MYWLTNTWFITYIHLLNFAITFFFYCEVIWHWINFCFQIYKAMNQSPDWEQFSWQVLISAENIMLMEIGHINCQNHIIIMNIRDQISCLIACKSSSQKQILKKTETLAALDSMQHMHILHLWSMNRASSQYATHINILEVPSFRWGIIIWLPALLQTLFGGMA